MTASPAPHSCVQLLLALRIAHDKLTARMTAKTQTDLRFKGMNRPQPTRQVFRDVRDERRMIKPLPEGPGPAQKPICRMSTLKWWIVDSKSWSMPRT